MSQLFQPISFGSLSLPNRILIAPMCQYSAVDGCAGNWHAAHLGHLAMSGAGLLILEATAVSPEARISPGDLGLWNDDTETALARVLDVVRECGPIPLAIQLGHAGRKASCRAPWDGGGQIRPGEPGGWHTVAPSAVPHHEHDVPPEALDADAMRRIRDEFAAAARRAARLGFDGIELHAAHGYLLHQFLSPLSNRREDEYGGSLPNRMRFPLEVFDAVRDAFPADRPVWARVSATDWVEDGWDLDSTIAFARALQRHGSAATHVSSGGLSPHQSIVPAPGYQVPLATAVKRSTTIPSIAVGLITDADQAERIVATGEADGVSLARAMLFDPRWPWHAAARLGARVTAPKQYLRSAPREHADLFIAERPARP
ncbi:NADH:flavin oxidoreductase/NADH oxidase [Rhizosaccharibacter radicis]|uniref:NADH:flavin oxidoreductase/NADH oxidase n=1 Tax=Rhizosaccharibacter radicis TaxID=2782605 RepID=A0ABT1VUV1_9PROT|nr:NADH:flavin oxidoreductase/NADH oxidase [Acetobacteraceae bacterium KSS12]